MPTDRAGWVELRIPSGMLLMEVCWARVLAYAEVFRGRAEVVQLSRP